MRREHISYMDNIPVNIQMLDIREYPIHWHQSIEILMILKGSVNVTIESDTYRLVENEVEIINLEEAHRIFSDEENLVLMLHMDLNFFQRYYDDIKNMYFYTECSFEGEPQVGEKYDMLKKYLSVILCEVVQKGEDYDVYVRETLIKLLYLLINEFHYLIYENKDLRDNAEQLQRYHRIAKYIFNNYNNKISLQDIAKKEFLSAQYLSNEIKNAMGISFQDFVNLTRAEESVKLLLDTDMTISEISEEVGFSHTRYYNKHFKRHYKMTPLQYRKKYKLDDKKYQETKKIKLHDPKIALEYMTSYLENYERYNYEEKIVRINIDASQNQGDFLHEYKDTLILPKAYRILEKGVWDALRIIQQEIGFDYGQIRHVFSEEMGIYSKGMINLKKIKKVMDIILALDLRPDIVLNGGKFTPAKYEELVIGFLEYFKEEYGSYEISKWRYTIDSNAAKQVKTMLYGILKDDHDFLVKEECIKNHEINPAYDTAYMIPSVIHQIINHKPLYKFKAMDELSVAKNPTNIVFFGDRGLLNWEGLKKPWYHAFYFLNQLGDTIVTQGDDYIVTSKGDDFQVLLYTHNKDIETLGDIFINKLREPWDVAEKSFSLNITNMFGDYRVIIYEISEGINSVYNQWKAMGKPDQLTDDEMNLWKAMGKPDQLTDDEMNLLKLSSMPRITLNYRKNKPLQHINLKIKGCGAVLILFKAC